MIANKQKEAEAIQKIIARHVATHPVGRNLALIGGFRYRFLNASVRISNDIDYHWDGDLKEKQRELTDSFKRRLLLEVSRLLGYSGSVSAHTGPDADSPVVRVVDLSFWKDDVPYSRIEIPVEVTCIRCVDQIEVRTVEGTIYATASEADMIESKVIAILGRITLRHRDILDVFLFQDCFRSDSAQRLKSKLQALMIDDNDLENSMSDLRKDSDYHAKAIQEVIDTQLEAEAAAQLNDTGGGITVLNAVMNILNRYICPEKTNESN